MAKLLAILLIVIPIADVFGQSSKYPNELHGFKLIGLQKLKSFIVGVTPRDVVEAELGKTCQTEYCYLDENWSVQFDYFSKGDRSLPRDPKFPRSVPITKYDGRLRMIKLKPKIKISLKPGVFSGNFSREAIILAEGGPTHYGRSKLWYYQDRSGLTYVVLAELSHLGSKNELLEIEYGLPPADEARAFEEW
jgi:hypothetical protein